MLTELVASQRSTRHAATAPSILGAGEISTKLRAYTVPTAVVRTEGRPSDSGVSAGFKLSEDLNEAQRRLITMVHAAAVSKTTHGEPKLIFVQGEPGTGKSYCVSKMVDALNGC